MAEKSCKTCEFWQEYEDHEHHGICCYNPPSPEWPRTRDDDWCGKYKLGSQEASE